MHLLIILLLILFLVPTLIFSVVSWVLSIFGLRSKKRWFSASGNFNNHSSNAEPKHEKKDRRKIFEKDEGEYVDFEEIK